MDIDVDQRQVTQDEKLQITQQVKAELVDHLYEGCLPGTISGVVISIALFLIYYKQAQTFWLLAWLAFFNLMMVALTGLYYLYIRHKSMLSLQNWEWAYVGLMAGCAIAWVPGIFLLPQDFTRQYLALTTFFLATTGYATGSIGQFGLCVLTLNIMLLPLMAWSFYQGGLFYNIIGVYSLIYMGFMIGINLRSTRWFKESLKLKLENTLVSYQANHDLLTDLPNQRLLPQYVESSIEFVQKSNQTFALVCFSLNRMEVIEDSLGAQAGNAIIRSVSDRLSLLLQQLQKSQNAPRVITTISRKDTFNLVFVPMEESEVMKYVEQLFSILADPFYLEQRSVRMTASIGISLYPKDGLSTQALLINADAAMLSAKQFGGNRLEFYREEINAQLPKQLELESDLHTALQNKEFQLNYQPLIDIETRQIYGMEALIRWPHAIHGFISPMHFIPIAEETGLIIPIGEWVLQEACFQTKRWHDMGFKGLKVAVNLAEKQLRHESIIDTIKRAILLTGIDPLCLELEITETAILDEKVIPIIQQIKSLGLSLAVDDFGTGYSGLSYLKRFSVDKLKIDQSFIRDIPDNNDSMTIVSAIIAMAKELKLKTLAEGVETLAQLDFLTIKGCDFAQGYYFSKPVPANLFTEILEKQKNAMRNIEAEK
ncbi:MAG: GGDEF domain-containing protein [Gammaproteobacteria bacterium]|nr:GGDEF domain-containing protein [Gammaproteobacteria bacterium]